MTTTAIRQMVADVGGYPSPDQRRQALIELAQEVDLEERCSKPTWWPVCPLVVPTLAAAVVVHPMGAFLDLVFATAEFRKFCGNETDWLIEHDRGTSAESRVNEYDRLQADIDLAADRLMGRAS